MGGRGARPAHGEVGQAPPVLTPLLLHPPLPTPACSYGRDECVRLLLGAGADVGARNDKGQTAAEVVRGEARNPLNQDEALLAVLEGKAAVASLS